MRVSRQIAVVAILGGAGYFGWTNWPQIVPHLAQVPGLEFLQPKAQAATGAPQAGAQPGGGQAARPGGGAPAGGPGGGRGQGGAGGAMVVEVAAIRKATITEVTEAVGNTRAFESVQLTSKVSGIVEKILFEEGQSVKAGQEILLLDGAERQAELEAARAAIRTARAQREETNQKFERAQALRRAGAGTEALVADLQLQLRTAETAIAASEARERAAAARLDDYILRAPFAGRVGFRNISLGALLDNKVVVTTLDDVSRIRLDFAVPETLISRIAVGATVEAKSLAYPDRKFPGRVAVIDTRIDPVTRSAKLSAVIDNPEILLKPGMFMNVALKVAVRDAALIAPEEAVVAEGPRQIAFVVKDGKIERRAVIIGQRQEGVVEISEGLSEGDVIVVRGVQRVRNGMNVSTKPAFPGALPVPAAGTPAARPGQPS
jgi:membrane fusion protein (multidrug efflux system)